ncbi:hypothetical protein [Tsukamurella sp. PLM1]|uniref:hypothetical protein n=1 Tax=Tsukamurella sp. PLM1 TaxID=2929795 RepID=UPI0020556CB7|nr:hypothetical protein [Tsukamurella sp. PLM1]BDH59765.1 hypothetical protein MTP03_47040 [Tsukamurella sp. PLM1]
MDCDGGSSGFRWCVQGGFGSEVEGLGEENCPHTFGDVFGCIVGRRRGEQVGGQSPGEVAFCREVENAAGDCPDVAEYLHRWLWGLRVHAELGRALVDDLVDQ